MEDREKVRNMLYEKYKTMELSERQVAEAVNKSTATLGRWRKEGIYLTYCKNGNAKNSTITYNLFDVVNYLLRTKGKVI